MRSTLSRARTIVVKVGSSTLTHENGRLHLSRLEQLVRQLADIANEDRSVLLVSSGAVAAGIGRMAGRQISTDRLGDKQALAAIGQGLLMQTYEKLFAEYGYVAAQVLLTNRAFLNDSARENAIRTLDTLLSWNVVPIINENDTVATDEIRVGDNDTLAAQVACLIGADLLIILTDTDGVYTDNPRLTNGSVRIAQLTPDELIEREQHLSTPGSPFGTGGMATKLAAARIAGKNGIPTVIGPGNQQGTLRRILSGEDVGTLCLPPLSQTGND